MSSAQNIYYRIYLQFVHSHTQMEISHWICLDMLYTHLWPSTRSTNYCFNRLSWWQKNYLLCAAILIESLVRHQGDNAIWWCWWPIAIFSQMKIIKPRCLAQVRKIYHRNIKKNIHSTEGSCVWVHRYSLQLASNYYNLSLLQRSQGAQRQCSVASSAFSASNFLVFPLAIVQSYLLINWFTKSNLIGTCYIKI